jgi:hypothetical protein
MQAITKLYSSWQSNMTKNAEMFTGKLRIRYSKTVSDVQVTSEGARNRGYSQKLLSRSMQEQKEN